MTRRTLPGVRCPTAHVRTAAKALSFAVIVGVAACSLGGGPRGAGGSLRDEITRSQIEVLPDGTAFNVVERLRPRWLSARTQASPWNPNAAYAMVFLDELLLGPLGMLDRISINQIERIEYLNARDATTRYGTGYLGGIIRIVTRNTGQPRPPDQEPGGSSSARRQTQPTNPPG